MFGAAWALLNPLILLGLYWFVFARVFKSSWSGPESEAPYALLIFFGHHHLQPLLGDREQRNEPRPDERAADQANHRERTRVLPLLSIASHRSSRSCSTRSRSSRCTDPRAEGAARDDTSCADAHPLLLTLVGRYRDDHRRRCRLLPRCSAGRPAAHDRDAVPESHLLSTGQLAAEHPDRWSSATPLGSSCRRRSSCSSWARSRRSSRSSVTRSSRDRHLHDRLAHLRSRLRGFSDVV